MLIPEQFRAFIDELEKNDEGIRSVKDWFDNMPDISPEEFEQQCKEFEEMYNIDKK